MSTLKIKIPSELFAPAESSSFEGTYDVPVLKAGPDLYSFAEPLTWSVDVTNTGDALLVSGSIEGTGRTACVRCLEAFDQQFTGEVEGFFLLHEEDEPLDDMEEDEFDVLDASGIIDLEPLLQAALLVDAPLLPLCSDDCKGLCPDCGINLNNETCDCEQHRQERTAREEEDKNPFSVLRAIDFGDED